MTMIIPQKIDTEIYTIYCLSTQGKRCAYLHVKQLSISTKNTQRQLCQLVIIQHPRKIEINNVSILFWLSKSEMYPLCSYSIYFKFRQDFSLVKLDVLNCSRDKLSQSEDGVIRMPEMERT